MVDALQDPYGYNLPDERIAQRPVEPPESARMLVINRSEKSLADRRFSDVVSYLIRHMDRTFATARQVVAIADRESLAGQRSVSVPLIKDILNQITTQSF